MQYSFPSTIQEIEAPESAPVAVIGGTHMNDAIFKRATFSGWFQMETPEGPSPRFFLGESGGVPFVYTHFHGESKFVQTWLALAALGVREALSGASCGGINRAFRTDDVVIPDDMMDQNIDRPPSFPAKYLPSPDLAYPRFNPPMDETLRQILIDSAREILRPVETFNAVSIHPVGVVLQSRGGRFETPAEIRAAKLDGADLVTMNLCTEIVFARTLGIHFAALGLVSNPAEGVGDWSWEDLSACYRKMNPACTEIILRAVAKAGAIDPSLPRTGDPLRRHPPLSSE
jgi:5'-methylthioadenosine phosphorylase